MTSFQIASRPSNYSNPRVSGSVNIDEPQVWQQDPVDHFTPSRSEETGVYNPRMFNRFVGVAFVGSDQGSAPAARHAGERAGSVSKF